MLRRNFLRILGGSAFGLVNFTDFAEFAEQWLETKDVEDLAEFADSWLQEKDMPLQDSWTISFFWQPESSWREIHGQLPIALIKDSGGNYLALRYEAVYDGGGDRDGGKFVLSDGTNDIEVTADDGWRFADIVKFAVVRDEGEDITLYVETPAEGTLDESDSDINLADAFGFIQFSANADSEVKGLGSYGQLKLWDTDLSESDVQKVFDLDSDAPDADISKSPEEMSFARDSIRFDSDLQQIESGKPLLQDVYALQRPDMQYHDGEVDAENLRFVHGNRAYCSDGNSLYWTEDGVNFTEEITLSSLADYGPHVELITGGIALDDGSFVICTKDIAGSADGKIWRKDPETGQWSLRYHFPGGYVSQFGFTGARGNEIAIGEYANPKEEPGEGLRVHYSNDYGQSWNEIYERPGVPAEGANIHIHLLTFHPDHTDVIYVAYGDGGWRDIMKLTCTNTADKTNADSWSAEPTNYHIQPTAVITHNGKIYWGHDGMGYDPLIIEHDPSDDSMRPVFDIPEVQDDEDSPYYTQSAGCDVWSIKKIDGLFYAAVAADAARNRPHNGLYVSTDCINWRRAYHIPGCSGVWHIGGQTDNGRIWAEIRRPADCATRPAYFEPLNRKSIQFAKAERGITNLLDSAADSYFDGSIGDWYFTNGMDGENSGHDTSRKLLGDGSLFLAKDNTTTYATARSKEISLAAGDYIVLSMWVYIPTDSWGHRLSDLGRAPRLQLWTYSGANLSWGTNSSAQALVHGNWLYVKAWGKATGTVDLRFRVFWTGFTDAPNDPETYEAWIDAVQVVKFDDIHYSGQFQPGGTPRADEHLIASVAKLSNLVEP